MGCANVPPFPITLPPFPPGVTIPVFTPPVLSDLNLCCNIPLSQLPIPAIALTIAFPPAVITTLNTITKFLQSYVDAYNELSISCPFQ